MAGKKRIALVLFLVALALGLTVVSSMRPPGNGVVVTPGVDPRRKFLLSARSSDGVRWQKDERVLAEAASTPQAFAGPPGIFVFFVRRGEELAVALQVGGTWRTLPLAMEGQQGGLSVDPHVVALPRGYRMYYTWQEKLTDPGAGGDNEVRSALSENLFRWRREDGVRTRGVGLVDPDVVAAPGGGVRMYYTVDTAHILSALSPDGLSFTTEPGRRIEYGCVSSTVREKDRYRMYFHRNIRGKAVVYMSESRDGVVFGEPVVVLAPGKGRDRESAESPSVVKLKDGRYFMVYVSYR